MTKISPEDARRYRVMQLLVQKSIHIVNGELRMKPVISAAEIAEALSQVDELAEDAPILVKGH